jgi:hypothetical protein
MNEVKMNTEKNTELSIEDLKKVIQNYESHVKKLQEANTQMLEYINSINISRADLLVKLLTSQVDILGTDKVKVLNEVFKSLKVE